MILLDLIGIERSMALSDWSETVFDSDELRNLALFLLFYESGLSGLYKTHKKIQDSLTV